MLEEAKRIEKCATLEEKCGFQRGLGDRLAALPFHPLGVLHSILK